MTISIFSKWMVGAVAAAGVGYGLTTALDTEQLPSTASTPMPVAAAVSAATDPAPMPGTAAVNADHASGEAGAMNTGSRSAAENDGADAPLPVTVAQAATGSEAAIAGDAPVDQRAVAADLLAATEDADRSLQLGPITACFDQMRAFACPIVGSVPIVKDIVGRISMELGISCPTVYSPTST